MKKQNAFLDLIGEIDEKFVYEASLPWEKQKLKFELKLLKIAVAGIVMALLIGGLSHTNEIKAAWNQITSWIQAALGIDENVESYIDTVGKTITKNGISITIKEVAADKNNLWVALSDNINNSKEEEFILLTEVYINGKTAQLDGTYDLAENKNGTEGQVYHYRMENIIATNDKVNIKMNVWLVNPAKMKDVNIEDSDGYIFEFTSNWKELEEKTININTHKTIKISSSQNLMISKMSLNDFSSTIYGSMDNDEVNKDYYLIGTDNEGNKGFYRITNYENTEIVFEESKNNIKYKGISPEAKSVTLQLYVDKEEKNKIIYKKNMETGIDGIYEEGE